MTPEQEYRRLYERMAQISEQQHWGDPFSYARSKEILAAIVLGHRVAQTFSGADAFNQAGQPVEYKSTIGKNPQGSYTGISVQETWEEQERYLREEKIAKYPEHYYNRFEDGKLVESWKMCGEKVLELLLPRLERKFSTVLTKKDPRLSANITWKDIQVYGTLVVKEGKRVI
jgi:hypothetical protein|tara:strand:- start:2149 stop:2664 length:516 start_codon:yes stop_codon:yes gene_type:complete